MARRFRRRRKYTWLPVGVGTQLGSEEQDDNAVFANFLSLSVPVQANAPPTVNTIIVPLTQDTPPERQVQYANLAAGGTSFAPSNMAFQVGTEYFLRRIVGKFHLVHDAPFNEDNDPSFPASAFVGCGIFIARANDARDASGIVTSDLPIGAGTLDDRNANYCVFGMDQIREPWIWRRTWLLGNKGPKTPTGAIFGTLDSNINAFTQFPTTTAGYGSVAEGGHIDAKTMRRVSNDDRLFLAISTAPIPFVLSNNNSQVQGIFDYRLLGALRRSKNRGNF